MPDIPNTSLRCVVKHLMYMVHHGSSYRLASDKDIVSALTSTGAFRMLSHAILCTYACFCMWLPLVPVLVLKHIDIQMSRVSIGTSLVTRQTLSTCFRWKCWTGIYNNAASII